ncbi:Retroviral aspartyl protease [Candidatus Dojkabacteria bacterium]|nr:Retroviral aspartyl protease [Candidatus Dojkabacteria bacterium]
MTTKILNPREPKKGFSRKFLVDSGAVYSVVDKKILEGLKIKPSYKREFILANGQTIKKEVGEAMFEIDKERATSPVVFGDEGVFLLGAVTLETFGYVLDPVNRKLRGLPMLI